MITFESIDQTTWDRLQVLEDILFDESDSRLAVAYHHLWYSIVRLREAFRDNVLCHYGEVDTWHHQDTVRDRLRSVNDRIEKVQQPGLTDKLD